MRIKSISISEVKYSAFQLAKEFMTWDEPIPDFGTRFPNALESCLKTPFQTYERRHLYRGLAGKSAMLFYLMIKNHPFENGNKRIAVMTFLLFLHKNKKWLTMSSQKMYEFAKLIAGSDPKSKDVFIKVIQEILKENITELHK
ncbi:MAG: type II toxin-antitoxin system death-on-curing family toxin [Patescibacteria group bacterium]